MNRFVSICFTSFVLIGLSVASEVVTQKRIASDDDAMLQKYYECISCHDGTVASDVSAPSDARGKGIGWNSGWQNHPVGIDYDARYLQNNGGLHSIGSLPAEIVLVKGMVTCLSCHKLKDESSQDDMHESGNCSNCANCTSSKSLTIGTGTDDLCLTCHNL